MIPLLLLMSSLCGAHEAPAPVEWARVPREERALHAPPLEEVAAALRTRLGEHFAHVRVDVVPCPDLTRPPFALAAPGLGGAPTLLDLGGTQYLLPLVRRDKVYDLAALLRHLRRDPSALIGAGAGPWPRYGRNCEAVVDLALRDGQLRQHSVAVRVEPPDAPKGEAGYAAERLPPDDARTALLGNYLLSAGAPGPVLRVEARARRGDASFPSALRAALLAEYGAARPVALGGAFVLREGRARFHVMPDFSAAPLRDDAAVERWLHFFELRAPLVQLGTLVSADPGLDLRLQHFHGAGARADGGHYHGDTTPADAHYEGYFAVAERALRLDRPPPDAAGAYGRD